jgi:hypothetical protein
MKPHSEDDELDDLPPIDGDEVEEEGDEAEELDEEPADGGDPLDDSTGEDDPLEEIEVSGAETGWLDDAGESDALDVGAPETFGEEDESPTLLDGAEENELGEDELTFGAGLGSEDDSLVGDAGEEGFEEEEEDLREEDLPRLDSGQDDTAESDDVDLLEALPDEEVMTEEPRPPWDDRAWERVEGPAVAAAVEGIAWSADGMLVVGQGLARVDRKSEELVALDAVGLRGGAARGIAATGSTVFVSTPRSGVLVSEDGGATFREANGWRALFAPGEADGVLEIVVAGAELWGRGASGALVWSGDHGTSWSRALPEHRFEAIAADAASGQIVALAREESSTSVARGANGEGGKLVVSSVAVLPAGRILSFAVHRDRLAVALGRGAFRIDGTAGAAWERLEGTAGLTAMGFARGDGTLLIALHSEGEGRAWLLEARQGAPAFIVAEMGDVGASAAEEGDEARVRALCWDGAAGVVWAGGGFGLVALRPARH